MPSPREYEVGDSPVPGYRLLARLGSGGIGEVWRAEGPGKTNVALKIVRGLAHRSALHEIRALELVKHVHHPNLVAIHGIWLRDDAGRLLDDNWIVSETESGRFKIRAQPDNAPATTIIGEPGPSPASDAALPPVDNGPPLPETRLAEPTPRPMGPSASTTVRQDDAAGEHESELILAMGLGERSLHERLAECRGRGLPGIPVAELLKYFDDAARAIDWMNQEHQIQHCDIKPKNLLIVGGAAQVCDYGLAQALGPLRHGRQSAFTVAYAAPEVLSTRRPSQATDQYSLAVSYYELRTGSLPFASETVQGVLRAKQEGDLRFDKLPPHERGVLAKGTAVSPHDRFGSVGEMVGYLRRAVEADHAQLPLAPESAPQEGVSKAKWALAIGTLLVLLAAWAIGHSSSPTSELRRALDAYAAAAQVADERLATACQLLDRFPRGFERDRAELEIVATWKIKFAQARERNADSQALVRDSLGLARELARLEQAPSLRAAIHADLASLADQRLMLDQAAEASSIYDAVAQYLETTPQDAAPLAMRHARLGLARAEARLSTNGSGRDERQLARLRAIPELADLKRPDLGRLSPPERGAALVLLALASGDEGYRPVLPLLDQLYSASEIRAELTIWELQAIDELRDSIRLEIEPQLPLPEPWQSMVGAVWPGKPAVSLTIARAAAARRKGQFDAGLALLRQLGDVASPAGSSPDWPPPDWKNFYRWAKLGAELEIDRASSEPALSENERADRLAAARDRVEAAIKSASLPAEPEVRVLESLLPRLTVPTSQPR